MSIIDNLRSNALFAPLGDKELARVAKLATYRTFEKGQRIFDVGEPATHIYLLVEGLVILRLPGVTRDYSTIIATVEQGALFGISPLVGSASYASTATSETASQLLGIEAPAFVKLMRSRRLPSHRIMSYVAETYFRRYLELLRIYRLG